ncbi:MAG: squalene/phytoene synthase family protein [Alphaproteobacteria bacterium]
MSNPIPPNQPEIALLQELKAQDRDFYALCLFAPAAARGDLAALFGFHAALARVRDQVSEPMMGHIRLQWWRDALTALGTKGQPRHIVLDRLAAVQQRGIDLGPLQILIDARDAELAGTPPLPRSLYEPLATVAAAIVGQKQNAPLYARAAENYDAPDEAKIVALRRDIAMLPRHERRAGMPMLLMNDLARFDLAHPKRRKTAPSRLLYLLWRGMVIKSCPKIA